MACETRNAVLLNEVRTLFSLGVVSDSSDGELLRRFLNGDDIEAEAAFTVLVERHGPMVLRVCRHVLDDSHDAQDAFQATFLVFLRRAGSIRTRDSVASWLFGVAVRVARRARHAEIVRRVHERNAGNLAAATATSGDGLRARLALLHEEIARLPNRYREPIVLCHLQGLSTAAVARRLGCAHGTILSRLARGRERLRQKLGRQGEVEFMGLLAASGVPAQPVAAVSATLVNTTAQAVVPALSGRAIVAGTISPSVTALTQATLRTLFMTRVKFAAALLGMGVAGALLTTSIFRPALSAGLRAATTDQGKQGPREKPQTKEPDLLSARDPLDLLYQTLKRDHQFDDPRWPFAIIVRDVQERSLIEATFKHRVKGRASEYDALIQARRAILRSDLKARIIRVFLEHFEVHRFDRDADIVLIKNDTLEIPIPAQVPAPPTGRIVLMDSDQALSLDYSHDGKTLATAGFDGVVHLWDAVKGNQLVELKGEEKSTIRSVTFAPDGKTVVCVNDAGLVRSWNVATGALTHSFSGLSEPMRQAAETFMLDSIALAPDRHTLAVSGFGPTRAEPPDQIYELRMFDVHSGQPTWSHLGRGEQACCLAFAPDSEILARAGWKAITLWNAQDGEPIRTLHPTQGTIFALAFTPDGGTLVGGGNIPTDDVNHQAGLVTFWNVATGQITRTLKGHTGGVHAVAISPDGKTVASGGDGPLKAFPDVTRVVSEIRLWKIATGKLEWAFEGEQGTVRGLAFALDGKTLVYCDDFAVGLINAETGKLERTLTKTTLKPREP